MFSSCLWLNFNWITNVSSLSNYPRSSIIIVDTPQLFWVRVGSIIYHGRYHTSWHCRRICIWELHPVEARSRMTKGETFFNFRQTLNIWIYMYLKNYIHWLTAYRNRNWVPDEHNRLFGSTSSEPCDTYEHTYTLRHHHASRVWVADSTHCRTIRRLTRSVYHIW